ncbi:hypothetical protein PM082_000066 [Marasmius tenuissimus]|nr:hypothetical protein PM082_000066 [Marasmius tenuissimus]
MATRLTNNFNVWLSTYSTTVLRYTLDVCTFALALFRFPLAVILSLWLITTLFTSTVLHLVQPICVLPGISNLEICATKLAGASHGQGHSSAEWSPRWVDFVRLNTAEAATFEQLLDAGVGGSTLSLEIKKAEMASSDLLIALRFSEINSRDAIMESLGAFIRDARTTSRGLSKLSVKVLGAVDEYVPDNSTQYLTLMLRMVSYTNRIVAVNDYTLRTIQAERAAPGSVWPFWPQQPTVNQEVVVGLFAEAMGVLSSHVRRLILEAEVQLSNLDKLEEDLSVLHALAVREGLAIASAKNDILTELWTKFGGNRRLIRTYDENLALLRDLSTYRRRALLHVVRSLQILRTLSDEMEDLKERVSVPAMAGDKIPIEVHLKSISTGLERLRVSKLEAKERERGSVRSILRTPQGIDII